MKVKELKKLLAGCPPDATVVMSGDAEGNDFHVLDNLELAGDFSKVGNSVIFWPEHESLMTEEY